MEAVAAILTQSFSDSSISYIARQCRTLLQSCLEVPSLKGDEWAENRLAEFNLWAANSGVFAGDRASLDARLALQQDVKSVILSLLTVLCESLIQCQYIGRNITRDESDNESLTGSDDDVPDDEELVPTTPPESTPRAFSPWSDDSESESDEDSHQDSQADGQPLLDVPKTEAAQVIDKLARLTLAIRKTGTNSRSHKADRRFDPKAHAAFQRHLSILVLAKGSEEGRTSYDVDAGSLTPIQNRLISANLRRRNRFLYAQRHSRKLALEAIAHVKTDEREEEAWPMPVEGHQVPRNHEDQPDEPQPENTEPSIDPPSHEYAKQFPEPQLPALTATSASAATQPIDPGFIHEATPSQVAKTNITATTAKVAYPRPPEMVNGIHYFKCPCCCQVLPEMYRQNTLWKKHLMADICPYTCIIEDCPTPDQLHVTRNEWARHVEMDHQQCWQCFACTTSGKVPLVFPSVEGFMEHLREVHAETIKEEQYSTLIPEASRAVPAGISRCPLCDSTGPADSAPLMDHIAEHLHAFALRSLPWPRSHLMHEDTDDEDDGDDDYDYFLDNEYFDQGTDIGSCQDNATSDSDRDSEGLPSLHSSQASLRPPTISDAGSEVPDEDTVPSNPSINAPVIPPTYDASKGVPIELDPTTLGEVCGGPVPMASRSALDHGTFKMLQDLFKSTSFETQIFSRRNATAPLPYIDTCEPLEISQLLPQVVEGSWPQTCPPVFIPTPDPELDALSDRLLECMISNYRQRVEEEKSKARNRQISVINIPPSKGERSKATPLIQRARTRFSRVIGRGP